MAKPDGGLVRLDADEGLFNQADQPGVYRAQRQDALWHFAVNVSHRESDTAPMDIGLLEQHGIPLGTQPTRPERQRRECRLRDVELEGQQKLWQWLLLASLCVLACETWLAGRKRTHTPQLVGETT